MAPRFGTWMPLPEADSQPHIVPTQMIVHSIVGSARGAYSHFRNNTSIESHWITTKSGEAWQLMESDRSADANYKANRRPDGTGALSMETEDNRDPDRDPWTGAQLDTIVDWFEWGHRTYGIPLVLCRAWDAPGIGYHTLFPDHWTNVRGKTCPGKVRIAQFHDIVVPRLTQPTTHAYPEDDDVIAAIIEASYAEAKRTLDPQGKAYWNAMCWKHLRAGKDPVATVINPVLRGQHLKLPAVPT